MSDATQERQQEAPGEVNGNGVPQPAVEHAGSDAQRPETGPSAKFVPVNEAIKYRRRAQQAESRLQRHEQQLKDVQAQLEDRLEQLAAAEAQRDELQHQLETFRFRGCAERMLYAAGVADVETAMALLERRKSFSDELDTEQLQLAVDQLLRDKPFLLAAPPALPDKTASRRLDNTGASARLTQAATRAAASGNRRDVTQYLRLRRKADTAY